MGFRKSKSTAEGAQKIMGFPFNGILGRKHRTCGYLHHLLNRNKIYHFLHT